MWIDEEDAPSKTLQRLLGRGDAVHVHFDLGLRAYDVGDLDSLRRHHTAICMLPEAGSRCLQSAALSWRIRWLEGDYDGALELARRVMKDHPEDPHAPLELVDVLRELNKHEEVLEVLLWVSRLRPTEPDLWYDTGLAAERMEKWEVRWDCFRRVWELEATRDAPAGLLLSEERFLEVAEEVLEQLPPTVGDSLGNVAIFIEDYPAAWILESQVPDPRLLGLFEGPERAEERAVDTVATGPARIYLYRWNIERVCGSAVEVEEQIRITILHEIGHYLGLDEDDLVVRGLG